MGTPTWWLTKDDNYALKIFTTLLENKINWGSIGEYLCNRDPKEWVYNKETLRRYFKLIMLAAFMTDNSYDFHKLLRGFLRNHSANEYVASHIVKDVDTYSEIIYASMDEMIGKYSYNIGKFIVDLLNEFQKHADLPDYFIFKNQQYTDLAMKSLKTYTESATNRDSFSSIELSAFSSPSDSIIFPEAKEYIIAQLNDRPIFYAKSLICANEFEQDGKKKLSLYIREPHILDYILGNRYSFFSDWLKGIPSDDIQFVFKEILDSEKHNSVLIINALKDHYEQNDYAGYKKAIERYHRSVVEA